MKSFKATNPAKSFLQLFLYLLILICVSCRVSNLKGAKTLVKQVGFTGINLGRIDFIFEPENRIKISYSFVFQEVKTNFKI